MNAMILAAEVSEGYLNLPTLWFGLIATLWLGFFFLEGFDFGVGMLVPFVSRDDNDRRVAINTIGLFWDGNEVWLLVAGAGTFAAFPEWYASLFSGLYIPLTLLIVALTARGVAFEFRNKVHSAAWRAWIDRGLFVGSLLPPLLIGVAFSNMLRGVEMGADKEIGGSLFTLLNPYALVGGIMMVALCLSHGALYLSLKTDLEVRARAEALAGRLSTVAAALVFAFLTWTYINANRTDERGVVPGIVPIAALLAAIAVVWLVVEHSYGWAFVSNGLTIVLTLATLFLNLYPRVLVSSIDSAFDLTIWNASSTDKTLTLMTVVVVIFLPFILAYQGWTYYVFRQRISRERFENMKSPVQLLAEATTRESSKKEGPTTSN